MMAPALMITTRAATNGAPSKKKMTPIASKDTTK